MSDSLAAFETQELEEFIEQYMELDRAIQSPEDLLSILPGSREEQYQYALKYFLDPQKPHGF